MKNEEKWQNSHIYKPRNINLLRSFGFGVGDFIGGGGQTIISAWLLFFLTKYCNLTPVQGAVILSSTALIDAFVSLLMGTITDNFYRYKLGRMFGRRHFFILISAPVIGILFTIQWIAGLNFWYYYFVYLAFHLMSTIKAIPWQVLPTEMTEDYDERTLLSTTRMFISAGATFLATFIPGQLFRILGTNTALPFFINGAIFGVIFFISLLVIYYTTWERPVTPEMAEELEKHRASSGSVLHRLGIIFKEYWSTLKIRSFREHLLIYLMSFVGKDTFNTVFAFFIVYCVGSTAQVAAGLLSVSIIGVFVTIGAGYLFVKIGPRGLYTLSYVTMLVMLGGYWLIYQIHPSHLVMWLYIVSIFYQMGRAILEYVPWVIFPFIPDLDELIVKQSRGGVFSATMNFVRKSTIALSSLVIGIILDHNGFVKGASIQPLHTQHTITAILVFGTGGLILISLLLAWRFKLNKRTHDIVIKEIERLREGGAKADVTPETRKVCEALTGTSYDQMWLDTEI